MSHWKTIQRCHSNSPTNTASSSDVSPHELFSSNFEGQKKRQKHQHILESASGQGSRPPGLFNYNSSPTLSELHTATSFGPTNFGGGTVHPAITPNSQPHRLTTGPPTTTVYDCVSPETTVLLPIGVNSNISDGVETSLSSSCSSSVLSLVDVNMDNHCSSLPSTVPSHGNSIETTSANHNASSGLQSPALLSPAQYRDLLQQQVTMSLSSAVRKRPVPPFSLPSNGKERVGDVGGCWSSFLLCGLGEQEGEESHISVLMNPNVHNQLSVIDQMAVDMVHERQEDDALFFATSQRIFNSIHLSSEGQFITSGGRIKTSQSYTLPNSAIIYNPAIDNRISVNAMPSHSVCVRSLQPKEIPSPTIPPTNQAPSLSQSLYANVGGVSILLPSYVQVKRVVISSSGRETPPLSCPTPGNILPYTSSPNGHITNPKTNGEEKQQYESLLKCSSAAGAFVSSPQISGVEDENEKGVRNDIINLCNVDIDKMLMSHFFSSILTPKNSSCQVNGAYNDCSSMDPSKRSEECFIYNCMTVLPMTFTERCLRYNNTIEDNDKCNRSVTCCRGVNIEDNIYDRNNNNLMIFLRAVWLVLSPAFDFSSSGHRRDSSQESIINSAAIKKKTTVGSRGRKGMPFLHDSQLMGAVAALNGIINASSAAAEQEYQLHNNNIKHEVNGPLRASYKATDKEANTDSNECINNVRDYIIPRVYDLNKILCLPNQQQLGTVNNTAGVHYNVNHLSIHLPPSRLESACSSIISLIVHYTKQQVFSRLHNRDVDKKADTIYHYYHPSTLLSLLVELKTELSLETHYQSDLNSQPKQQQHRQKTPPPSHRSPYSKQLSTSNSISYNACQG
eukprot:Tbor_TRINITY_DN381_c0_g1::TRINITY_DN381_c0_g1_i1::g.15490::m.15490